MRRSPVVAVLVELAAELGLDLVVEPKYGFAAQLNLPDGRRRYFRGTTLDLNPAGACEIANDKDYATFFLKRLGYPVPEGAAFFTRAWARTIGVDRGPEQAWEYARGLGLPVFVKPNAKSQGLAVSLAHNRREFFRAVAFASRHDRVYLVQRPVDGRDFRLVVLDGEVISAYQRHPLSIVGDGVATVAQLLESKQEAFRVSGRDTIINAADWRIAAALRRRGKVLESVLPEGKAMTLLPVANLSTGGEADDVTNLLHPTWRDLSCSIARDMNLRYAGIDVVTPGTLVDPRGEYAVIEVNAAPGLDNYAAIGPEQKRRVEDLYSRVLLALTEAPAYATHNS